MQLVGNGAKYHFSNGVAGYGCPGQIKECFGFWLDTLEAPPTVLDWVQNRYKLPLMYAPFAYMQLNHESANREHHFVTEDIEELVSYCSIQVVATQLHICSPLSIATNSSGKMQLVLNLQYLNRFSWKQACKYEDLRMEAMLFRLNDYMFTFDLNQVTTTWTLPLNTGSILVSCWVVAKIPNTSTSLGLSTACYAFTKLMHPLFKLWHGKGLREIIYLNDGNVTTEGEEQAVSASCNVQEDLIFIINVPEAKPQAFKHQLR